VRGFRTPCLLFQLDDGVNLNICHFVQSSVPSGLINTHVERGTFLGMAGTSWIHLSLDQRPTQCQGTYQSVESYPCPIQFSAPYTLEGLEFSWDGSTQNQWDCTALSPTQPHCATITSTNIEILTAPRLLTPAENATIPQNTGGRSCMPSPTRGSGIQIYFDWTDVQPLPDTGSTIVGYELLVQRDGSPLPLVNTTVSTSQFRSIQCDSFVADSNLSGWFWRVRARDSAGRFSPWTPDRHFTFGPCRLPNGSPCFAPAGSSQMQSTGNGTQ
jgi:hypothetical protein